MSEGVPENVRPAVPELDAILGKRFNVLDDGFVRVVDYLGSDAAIVQAARVSYGEGTRKVLQDRGLIRYLLRHCHTTPFEMCELKLHLRVPMDCWRQWIRHRTANINEYSTRYSIAIDAAQRTAPDGWRVQSSSNRQGSDGRLDLETGRRLTERETQLQELGREVYRERIEAGVAREQARKDLPLSTYTEAYWKIDLHNLLHFLELRLHDSAQEEIRAYAEAIEGEILRRWVPLTWEAFRDYRLEGMSLSRLEVELMRTRLSDGEDALQKKLRSWGWLQGPVAPGEPSKPSRELRELSAKLERLGLPAAF